MRNLFAALCLLLTGLTSACVRASFSSVEGQDASRSDTASGGGDEPDATTMCLLSLLPNCSPQKASGATCDPVCQEGTCPCGEKCTVGVDGNAVCASVGAKPSRNGCTISLGGTVSQHDDCVPGNICLVPDRGSGYSYCFPICRTSADCTAGVSCGQRLISPISVVNEVSVSVCDPEYLSCNPDSLNPCCDPVNLSGCQPGGEHCYLVSPDPSSQDSRTVCDYTAGFGKRDATCGFSRDCEPGWACEGGKCRQVCDPIDPNPCPAGGPCDTASSGKQFGYCPP